MREGEEGRASDPPAIGRGPFPPRQLFTRPLLPQGKGKSEGCAPMAIYETCILMTDLQLWLVCAEFASVVALNMVLKFDRNYAGVIGVIIILCFLL